jgi:hypothetical protein
MKLKELSKGLLLKSAVFNSEVNLTPDFNMCFIRNIEMDNTLSLTDSSKLEITTKSGLVLTISNLPQYDQFDYPGWVAMLCDEDKTNTVDPTPTGDYSYKNFCTINKLKKTLTFATGTDLSDWEVGDNLVLYHPFINYLFTYGQKSDSIFPVSVGWRTNQTAGGPMFRHSDGRFILMVIGFQGSIVRMGYIYSTDLKSWTVGNGGNYVFSVAGSGFPDCASGYAHILGNCYPCNDGTGRYWCLINYTSTATVRGAHKIFYFDEDLTTFTWSTNPLMTDTGSGFAQGAITKIGNYYHFLYLLVDVAGITHRTINAAKSLDLEGPYTHYQIIVEGHTSNDGVAGSYSVDVPIIYDDGNKVFGLFGGTSQWSQSGTKGNRELCLLDFDKDTEVWSLSKSGPVIINPLYYQNLGTDYAWMGDHMGGCYSFFKHENNIYCLGSIMSVPLSKYQVVLLKLKHY